MKSLKKLVHSIKILSVTCAFLLCLFSSAAMADQVICVKQGPVPIKNGSFDVSITNPGPEFTVRSAIVSLPDGVTGTIENIQIFGPIVKGEAPVEFGCSPVKVKNGTDLIPACGGPAVLKAGPTEYKAKGSGFNSGTDITNFAIKLCDDFAKK